MTGIKETKKGFILDIDTYRGGMHSGKFTGEQYFLSPAAYKKTTQADITQAALGFADIEHILNSSIPDGYLPIGWRVYRKGVLR